MGLNFRIDSLLVFTSAHSKFFFSRFTDLNIVYGKNTSGKSTLFQSIVYCFGINEDVAHLREIMNLGTVFRIDGTLNVPGSASKTLTIIREDETIYIKLDQLPLKRFNGISGNSSFEHIKLKEYISSLFGFSLQLESKNEFKPAPIETILLPYYVSQKVGWVYLRKSFSSLDFYKNFKEDYLDYYLGIESSVDRIRKNDLYAQLRSKQFQKHQISDLRDKDQKITSGTN